jgi:hypothetical protein
MREKAQHRVLRLVAGLAAGMLCHSAYAVHFARTEVTGSDFDNRDLQPFVTSVSGADTSTPTFVNDAFARADLHGLLQVKVETSGDTSRFGTAEASGVAEIADVLRFSGPGLVTLTLAVNGTFSNDPLSQPNSAGNGIGQFASAELSADFGGPTASYTHAQQRDASDKVLLDDLCVGDGRICTPNRSGPGFEIVSSGTANEWHAVLTRSFMADASQDFTYGVRATLQVSAFESGNGRLVQADFAHSARLSIELAPGMTMTSESGAFLAPVPEPAEWEELTAAMFMLAAIMRTRRTKQCASEWDWA